MCTRQRWRQLEGESERECVCVAHFLHEGLEVGEDALPESCQEVKFALHQQSIHH